MIVYQQQCAAHCVMYKILSKRKTKNKYVFVNCAVSFLSLVRCSGMLLQIVLKFHFWIFCVHTQYKKHTTLQDEFRRDLSVPLFCCWSILSWKSSYHEVSSCSRPYCSAFSTNWKSVPVISDIRVNCVHCCLIYVRDALWHKSQKCLRVFSVACSRARNQFLKFTSFSALIQVRDRVLQ